MGDGVEVGGGDDLRRGLHGDQQPVLADELPGVGVVGGHRRGDRREVLLQLTGGVDVPDGGHPGEGLQPLADAAAELLGRLAGEGEAEDLVGAASPLATSHTTRAAMVSVLPAPAPATTSSGPGGHR